MSLTLCLEGEAGRLVWRNPEGVAVRTVELPGVRWSVHPDALRGSGDDGTEWEAGTAVAAPVGWLVGGGRVLEIVGGGAPDVADEQRRRQRHAAARRAADGTLTTAAHGIPMILEWAKLASHGGGDDALPSADAAEAEWLGWWADRPSPAHVPRAALDHCLQSILGLTRTASECQWELRPKPGWTDWQLEGWRIGSTAVDLALDQRRDGLTLRLQRRRGPAVLVTILEPTETEGVLSFEGEELGSGRARFELREEVTVRWFPR
ncbi:MAG: hypothetical protein U0974_03490 [Gemmatimonadales bacterium]|nr:hypothetical protein [Gemmatimonadales bacterium]MDZ4388778.1 hypothetical protein [Gemmatimonadales bacterium]